MASIAKSYKFALTSETDAIEIANVALAGLPLALLTKCGDDTGTSLANCPLAALPDGRLASGGRDTRINIWPKDFTDKPEKVLTPGDHVLSLAVLADGRLASSGEDGKIKIWPKDFKDKPEKAATNRFGLATRSG